ncbi:hypothetical protein AgCh_014851 [Apium graveolens]
MTRCQLPEHVKIKTRYGELIKSIEESEQNTYGMVLNTFHEIEPAYADHYAKIKKKHVTVHGRCSGVISCTEFRESRGNIYPWNPFVRKWKILPKFREKCYREDAYETIGFWFDKEKNDYEGKAPADDDDVDDGGGSERTESDDDNDRDMSVPYNVVSRGGLIIRG